MCERFAYLIIAGRGKSRLPAKSFLTLGRPAIDSFCSAAGIDLEDKMVVFIYSQSKAKVDW